MKTTILTLSIAAMLAATAPAIAQSSDTPQVSEETTKPKTDRKRLFKAGGLGCLAGGAAAFLSGKRDKALTGCAIGAAVGGVGSYRAQLKEAEELADRARAAGMTATVQTKEVDADGEKVQSLAQVAIAYDPATVANGDESTAQVFDRISSLAKKSKTPLTIAVEGRNAKACQVPLAELTLRGTFPPATAVDNCGSGQARILISPVPDLT
ncbi:hypothetical protein [Luteimonas sp. MC1750]|uniref:hypothetical protein n=1 Tax=Luteimonas sp. MC1750 TaxID=2799326 RepID=UPI0018F09F18|nr:hypothetical protein [Luteimonas sp. MC1750]MBJ6984032.1 hypothetical protein [Luteimonas sp. MC1750]QQO06844.1 hypothetical protein JGR68_05300 [Luteimonas sp. MC1750]